jgi:hypothetical protein
MTGTLAWDLAAHLAYGAGTGTTFWLLGAAGRLETVGDQPCCHGALADGSRLLPD